MYINKDNYRRISSETAAQNTVLVAVSKTKPVEAIRELYDMGHRHFGENYVQELAEKQAQLPADIQWHFIGHLQRNKVKLIAPFVHLIHGIDSLRLLAEVEKQAAKLERKVDVLLQVHIATEETKFGFDESELLEPETARRLALLQWVRVRGLMGMASFSDDKNLVRDEFQKLQRLFNELSPRVPAEHDFSILSIGMSGDYQLALESGSTMVRVGSLIFGSR